MAHLVAYPYEPYRLDKKSTKEDNMRKQLLNKRFVWMMALWAAIISVPPSNAFAFPSGSLSVSSAPGVRDAQINKVMSILSRPDAQLHLRLMRIDEKEVRSALAKLDDAQLAQVARKADTVKAAGDGALGVIIALLVITLLVVLIINLSNKRVVIKDAK